MRKIPTQLRAKQRVERILDATEALLIERGVGTLTVNDIATRAEVPIGSMYQYFNNRDEVLYALCDRHYRILGSAADGYFTNVRTVADFTRDVRKALYLCWDYTNGNAAFRELFFDVQAWGIVREIDWQDTLLNAERMSGALHSLVSYVPRESVLALCIIIGDSASSTARIAVRVEALRDELFKQFVAMVESRVFTLLRDNAALETAAHALLDAAPEAAAYAK
ncbi:TetR/AcrR family transcriptional regulator [uncultured Sphingomonas sp.]|uniref:TetR/AcrR family transcriptional regulator n=1 Tax=uncultured Sphingomonas sp. TaxID=158754 RepID=UPI0035C9E2A8